MSRSVTIHVYFLCTAPHAGVRCIVLIELDVKTMDIYDEIGDIDLKVRIGNVVFTILLTESFFNDEADFFPLNHNHSTYEAHFMLEGSGILQVGHEKVMLPQNSCCILGPGIYHTYTEVSRTRSDTQILHEIRLQSIRVFGSRCSLKRIQGNRQAAR